MTREDLIDLLRGDPAPRSDEEALDAEFDRVMAVCARIDDASPEAAELDLAAARARAEVEAIDPVRD